MDGAGPIQRYVGTRAEEHVEDRQPNQPGQPLSASERAVFRSSISTFLDEQFSEYQFTYRPKLERVIESAILAVDQYMQSGVIDAEVTAAIEASAMRAIQTVPLGAIDEMEIGFTKAVIAAWPNRALEAVEGAKRVALIWYDAFWPFEHPAAVAQAARFGNIANSLPAPVFMADLDGRIMFSSEPLDEMLSRGVGHIERHTIHTLFGRELSIGKSNPTDVELVIDGSKRYLRITVLPTDGPAGEEFFGFVEDQTNEVELEQIRDGVMNAISHELRTPLTAILGYLELLTHGQVEEKDIKGALSEAASEANKLNDLVNDILNFARFAGGTAVLRQTDWEVQPTIEQAVRRVYRSTEAGPAITVDPSLRLHADQDRFIEVAIQLLRNARQHGGRTVEISATSVGGGVELRVLDDGDGFPFRETDRALQPFVHGAGMQPGQGAGLGLTICRSIAQAHGGTLTIANRRGAAVTVWFPGSSSESEA